MSGFKHLHKGYEYQDIATAHCLAQCLIQTHNSVLVDKKTFTKDLFDDVKVQTADFSNNYQFKYVVESGATLVEEDFKTKKRDIRIDNLIESFKEDPKKDQDYYFLVSTLNPPTDDLLLYLRQIDQEHFFSRKCISI